MSLSGFVDSTHMMNLKESRGPKQTWSPQEAPNSVSRGLRSGGVEAEGWAPERSSLDLESRRLELLRSREVSKCPDLERR